MQEIKSPYGGGRNPFQRGCRRNCQEACCAPLEMVSTVMMCRGDECGSMGEELADAWRHDGMSGLFKGNGANCLKFAPSRGTQVVHLARDAAPLSSRIGRA